MSLISNGVRHVMNYHGQPAPGLRPEGGEEEEDDDETAKFVDPIDEDTC